MRCVTNPRQYGLDSKYRNIYYLKIINIFPPWIILKMVKAVVAWVYFFIEPFDEISVSVFPCVDRLLLPRNYSSLLSWELVVTLCRPESWSPYSVGLLISSYLVSFQWVYLFVSQCSMITYLLVRTSDGVILKMLKRYIRVEGSLKSFLSESIPLASIRTLISSEVHSR